MSTIFNAIWKKYDKDGSNSIDMEEFRNMCADLGHYMNDAQLKAAFQLLDRDGDKSVSREEFLAFWREDDRFARLQLDDAQLAKMVQLGDYFRHFDRDRNGTLDKKEFAAMGEHMAKNGYNLKMMNFNFDAIDKDGSGAVTFNEYIAYMVDMGALDKVDGTRPVHG